MLVKRTALDGMKHEDCWVGKLGEGKSLVFYMSDDEPFEYIYKFVSKHAYDSASADSIPPALPPVVPVRVLAPLPSSSLARMAALSGCISLRLLVRHCQRCKRVRAILRLVRRDLDRTYSSKNKRSRDIARGLSDVRDAVDVIEAIDRLYAACKNRRDMGSLRATGAVLYTRHREIIGGGAGIAARMEKATEAF